MMKLLIAIILLILNNYVIANSNTQPLEIYAQKVKIDQARHKSEYIGNVRISQGETHLLAQKAILYSTNDNKIKKALAFGDSKNTQAHYWTQLSINKPPLHAYANMIIYNPDSHVIKLIGNARVVNGDNILMATKINYNTLTQHVIAQGNQETQVFISLKHVEKYKQ